MFVFCFFSVVFTLTFYNRVATARPDTTSTQQQASIEPEMGNRHGRKNNNTNDDNVDNNQHNIRDRNNDNNDNNNNNNDNNKKSAPTNKEKPIKPTKKRHKEPKPPKPKKEKKEKKGKNKSEKKAPVATTTTTESVATTAVAPLTVTTALFPPTDITTASTTSQPPKREISNRVFTPIVPVMVPPPKELHKGIDSPPNASPNEKQEALWQELAAKGINFCFYMFTYLFWLMRRFKKQF